MLYHSTPSCVQLPHICCAYYAPIIPFPVVIITVLFFLWFLCPFTNSPSVQMCILHLDTCFVSKTSWHHVCVFLFVLLCPLRIIIWYKKVYKCACHRLTHASIAGLAVRTAARLSIADQTSKKDVIQPPFLKKGHLVTFSRKKTSCDFYLKKIRHPATFSLKNN